MVPNKQDNKNLLLGCDTSWKILSKNLHGNGKIKTFETAVNDARTRAIDSYFCLFDLLTIVMQVVERLGELVNGVCLLGRMGIRFYVFERFKLAFMKCWGMT